MVLPVTQVEVAGGKLRILREGRNRKFKRAVAQKTFAASAAHGRPVLYVTERAVFRLVEGRGIQLTEARLPMASTPPHLACMRLCMQSASFPCLSLHA